MHELVRQLATLQETVRVGFASEARRMDDLAEHMEKRQDERHAENADRLERIEAKQDITNGNVARHDAILKYLVPAIVAAVAITAAIVMWVLRVVAELQSIR